MLRHIHPSYKYYKHIIAIPFCTSEVREDQGSTRVCQSVIQSVSQLVSKNLHTDTIITILYILMLKKKHDK